MNKFRCPSFSAKKCAACWKCVDVCPQKAIRRFRFLWHKHALPLHAKCIGCNKCISVCPNKCYSRQV
ncbi:MAG: 4Fe-4S binding protein [Duncaniella sp.]|nr:4Fe-4S binding protein [Duncaniella sp.]